MLVYDIPCALSFLRGAGVVGGMDWVVGKGAERVLPEGTPQGYSNMLAGTHSYRDDPSYFNPYKT